MYYILVHYVLQMLHFVIHFMYVARAHLHCQYVMLFNSKETQLVKTSTCILNFYGYYLLIMIHLILQYAFTSSYYGCLLILNL